MKRMKPRFGVEIRPKQDHERPPFVTDSYTESLCGSKHKNYQGTFHRCHLAVGHAGEHVCGRIRPQDHERCCYAWPRRATPKQKSTKPARPKVVGAP